MVYAFEPDLRAGGDVVVKGVSLLALMEGGHGAFRGPKQMRLVLFQVAFESSHVRRWIAQGKLPKALVIIIGQYQ